MGAHNQLLRHHKFCLALFDSDFLGSLGTILDLTI